jgi:signal transduction histidine kinase
VIVEIKATGAVMVKNNSSSKVGVRYKLFALILGANAATALLFRMLTCPLLIPSPVQPRNGLLAFFVSILIVLAVSALAYLISRTFIRRLEKINAVTHAWIRGNLNVRIDDPTTDEVGILAENLDQLAGHLEEDEEDLSRLSQSNTRLTDQVRALAVVEERNRLARELHDSVKQHLFSLAMTASAIKTRFETLDDVPKDVVEMVDEIVNASQSAQKETTRLIEDLRPGSLEERGLAAALNDYTLLFGAQEHLLIYLDVNCNDQHLPPAVAEALYRIAQESLHNVARHAQATRVDVELLCAENRVILKIEDNGVGFDTTRTRQGLGISNMQERLLSVGGRLTIESLQSIGTNVTAEVRLKPQPETLYEPAETQPVAADPRQWSWLGQRLVVPVGQIWPWLPDDEDRHLAEPTISSESSPLMIRRETRFLAIRTLYTLRNGEQRYPLCRILRERAGYTWECNAATWDLRHVQGLRGRSILFRNGQPLAAMQYQGRQMHTWSQIVYHTRIYKLASNQRNTDIYSLEDDGGRVYAEIRKSDMTVQVHQFVPTTLLIMVITRFLDEASVANS